MIHEIYTVKDKAVEAFLQPFFSPTLGSAVRAIGAALADPEHTFSKNMEDYTLWRIGTFDDVTGQLMRLEPEKVAPLSALKK